VSNLVLIYLIKCLYCRLTNQGKLEGQHVLSPRRVVMLKKNDETMQLMNKTDDQDQI